ncbi:MAG: hydrogenase maturation protease [Bryobacteraceae bacterium]
MTPGSVERPVLVLGVGNALLGDDSAGLLLLAELERDADQWGDQVEFLDGGTQGLALLDRIASRRALLVLDAVALGAEPGTVHVLRGWKHAGERASTAHESNVAELLQASTLLGECPEQVTVVGIEPAQIATGIGISDAVANAVGAAVEAVRRELAESLACV